MRHWREAISRDPELTSNAGLSRGVLEDHIPDILGDFERHLRAEHALHAMEADLQHRRDAAEHGRQRWQQGYDVRETLREWGHLQSVLLEELERFAGECPDTDPGALSAAREILTKLCMEGNCESASRYMQMQQAEAASRMRDLETSLRELQALEDERARLLRETAHDLRGSVSVIANATALLGKPDMAEPQRDRFYAMLQQRIRATGAMLADLAELARLEAGKDPLSIESFDAAERVREVYEVLRPLAAARKLYLRYEGVDSLPVEGDLLKLQRIVQNLLVNALQATERGGIVIQCSTEGERRWVLSIEDTGAGFTLQAAGELRHALKRATDEAHRAEAHAAARKGKPPEHEGAAMLVSASTPGAADIPAGEGIGLSIVKRLCDILGATVDLDTAPGRGTTFRVTFPIRYGSEEAALD